MRKPSPSPSPAPSVRPLDPSHLRHATGGEEVAFGKRTDVKDAHDRFS